MESGTRIKTSTFILMVAFALIPVLGLVSVLLMPASGGRSRRDSEQTKAIAQHLEAAKPKAPLAEADKAAILEFGKNLAAALTSANGPAARNAVDYEVFADRVCVRLFGFANPNQLRDDFVESSANASGGIFLHLMGCQIKSLRLGTRDGFPSILLRSVDEKRGLRFFEVLVRLRGKQVGAVDVYSYAFANFMSEECADTMQYVTAADEAREIPLVHDQAKREAARNMITCLRLGNVDGVISQYHDLPPNLKDERLFFRLYIQGMQEHPDPSPAIVKQYRDALLNADRILGPDNACALSEVDFQLQDGDFEAVEKTLNKTDALVGKDAYLVALRGLSLLRQKKVAEAEQRRAEAVAMEPALDILADLQRLIYAAQKDYVKLVSDLREYQTKSKRRLTRQELSQQPEFADFLKSPEFLSWEKEGH